MAKNMTSVPALLQSIPTPRLGADGIWNGRLTLTSRDRAATFEATEELLGYAARLSASGAFAIDIEHIGDCRFDMETISNGRSLDVRLSARHLHPGVWRVALQILAHCHAMEPYDSIALVGESVLPAGAGRSAEVAALLQPYPVILDPSIFAALAPQDNLDESFSLSVACAREVSNDDLQELSTLVEDWGSLVYVGGFTPVTEAIDAPLLDKPDIVRQGWSAFDITIRHWSPNIAALASLVNLLIVQRGKLSIESIEIE